MAFPDHTCLPLFNLFLSVSSSLTQISFSRKHQRGRRRGGQMNCWYTVSCVGLLLSGFGWHCVKLCCVWSKDYRWATRRNRHVDTVKVSADVKQFSCVNQSDSQWHEYVSVNHHIRWLGQEITGVLVETSLSGPFMTSQKILCNSLPLSVLLKQWVSTLLIGVCSVLLTSS